MQRLSDLLFSVIAITVLSPILLSVMLILRFSGEGEVFYSQVRIGKGQREFRLLKFATMLKDSPKLGTGTVTLANDPRILPAGRFLRKTKLNELPQIFNILRGEMSLIGPRPLTQQTFQMYPPEAQRTIATVTPGLSGVGSIVFRNEEKILTDADQALEIYARDIAPYKGELEIWFVENRSFALYLKSIFATIWVVLFDSEDVTWRLFPTIPAPPKHLQPVLGYR